MYYDVRIYVPKLLDTIGIIILLWLRKKIYGYPFRRIKLRRRQPAGQKPVEARMSAGQASAGQKPGETGPVETNLTTVSPAGRKPVEARFAIVSPEDFEEVNKHKWRAVNNHNETYYAVRMTYPCGRKKLVMMHREIMKLPPFDIAGGKGRLVIDHGDGDGLNNTRENLSIVTAAENSYNRRKCKNECSSRYKGVSREKKSNRWRAIINYKGIPIRLGSFDNEIEAAKAYDEAAKELYREYAVLNFTTEPQRELRYITFFLSLFI